MAIESPCKSFAAEVGSLKTKWQLGTDATLPPEHIRNMIGQIYTNYVADGTWNRESEESSQVIALATKVGDLERKLQRLLPWSLIWPKQATIATTTMQIAAVRSSLTWSNRGVLNPKAQLVRLMARHGTSVLVIITAMARYIMT